jgi:Mor family transcriptional regulator
MKITDKEIKKIIEMYQAKCSLEEIAQSLSISPITVRKYLTQSGIKPDFKFAMKKRKNDLIEDYKKGMKVKDLVKKYKYTKDYVKKILKDSGVWETRRVDWNLKESKIKEIIKSYRDGDSIQDLSQKMGASPRAIQLVLKKNNVLLRTWHNHDVVMYRGKKYDLPDFAKEMGLPRAVIYLKYYGDNLINWTDKDIKKCLSEKRGRNNRVVA